MVHVSTLQHPTDVCLCSAARTIVSLVRWRWGNRAAWTVAPICVMNSVLVSTASFTPAPLYCSFRPQTLNTELQVMTVQISAVAEVLHSMSGIAVRTTCFLVPLTAVFYTSVGGLKVPPLLQQAPSTSTSSSHPATDLLGSCCVQQARPCLLVHLRSHAAWYGTLEPLLVQSTLLANYLQTGFAFVIMIWLLTSGLLIGKDPAGSLSIIRANLASTSGSNPFTGEQLGSGAFVRLSSTCQVLHRHICGARPSGR